MRSKNFLERSPFYVVATNLTKQCPLTKGLTRKFNRAYERDLTMLNTNIIMLAKNNINVMYEKVFFLYNAKHIAANVACSTGSYHTSITLHHVGSVYISHLCLRFQISS